MKRVEILGAAIIVAALLVFAAHGRPLPLPSVRMSAASYADRDLSEINRALDDFDAQADRRGIDLKKSGLQVELRLIGN